MNTTLKGRVLAVDDQPENLELLTEILTDEGYLVREAQDGEEALDKAFTESFDCIVLDVMMPRLDGFHVCRKLKSSRKTCWIPVVMLTALSDPIDKVLGLNMGADDYLVKPVHPDELLARVRSLVRVKHLRDGIDLAEAKLLSALPPIDSATPSRAGHSERVAIMAIRLARHLGFSPAETETVAWGAILHDIGKAALPRTLIRMGSSAAGGAREAWEQHPVTGNLLLAPISSFRHVRPLVRGHHERLNGTGFPDRLSGPAFTREIEIVALTNLFDNLLCDDVPPDTARLELRNRVEKGEFHSQIVEEFLREDATLPYRPRGPVPDWQEQLTPLFNVPPGIIAIAGPQGASRMALREILETAGHQIVDLSSLSELGGAEESESIDLAVTAQDALGPEALEDVCLLRAQRPVLPIVLCSPLPGREDRMKAVRAGVDDFFSLPLNALEVVARVKSLMRIQLYSRDEQQYQEVVKRLLALGTARSSHPRL